MSCCLRACAGLRVCACTGDWVGLWVCACLCLVCCSSGLACVRVRVFVCSFVRVCGGLLDHGCLACVCLGVFRVSCAWVLVRMVRLVFAHVLDGFRCGHVHDCGCGCLLYDDVVFVCSCMCARGRVYVYGWCSGWLGGGVVAACCILAWWLVRGFAGGGWCVCDRVFSFPVFSC